ncbi:DUF1643 domain-containing protein [Microbacterium sp. SS28]|uniref:DUF1643 domain-containing protein n=1 Tax=Microbacterium sp. SS28 TaxID=2919948 RepID=UPI001FAA7B4C|nr:DUF1643 domain-containing protein [Microbacterium sp. SS28]
MIAYLPGHEASFWDPYPSSRTHRFTLGNATSSAPGARPLIAICMNPSHANEFEADRTVNRLIEASIDHAYTGWIMLNLYPERATKPSNLSPYDPGLSAANCAAIARELTRHQATEVLGAWGGNLHPTIRRAKQDVLALVTALGARLFSFDPPTVVDRQPRHPWPRTGRLPMLGPKRYLMQPEFDV